MLVSAERAAATLDELIGDDDDIAIAAITVAELLVGVELASPRRRPARQEYLDRLLATIPIESYDADVARAHAQLLVHTRQSGRARGAHDLIIAATAAARRRIVVTHDQRSFDDLPGVLVRSDDSSSAT